jgi:hypothetical protein
MTCKEWNSAVAKVNKLPKSQQAVEMDKLYNQLKRECKDDQKRKAF